MRAECLQGVVVACRGVPAGSGSSRVDHSTLCPCHAAGSSMVVQRADCAAAVLFEATGGQCRPRAGCCWVCCVEIGGSPVLYLLQSGGKHPSTMLLAAHSHACLSASCFICYDCTEVDDGRQLQALHAGKEEGRGPARLQAARELAGLLDSAASQLSQAPSKTSSDGQLLQQV